MTDYPGRHLMSILSQLLRIKLQLFGAFVSAVFVIAIASNAEASRNPIPREYTSATSGLMSCSKSNYSPEEIFQQAKQSVALIIVDGVGSGSGFAIDNRGGNTLLLTNSHVLNGQRSASVHWIDGTEHRATLVKDGKGSADANDIALIEIKGYTRPILRIKSEAPNIGAQLIAIGSPGAGDKTLDFSLTSGVLRAPRRIGIWPPTSEHEKAAKGRQENRNK